MTAGLLKGKRVLVVEDRYLLASELAREVEALGGEVLGPFRLASDAQDRLDELRADVALLDIHLEGEFVYPLAEQLARTGTPFLFVSGYERVVLPPAWRERPLLTKPITGRALNEALTALGF